VGIGELMEYRGFGGIKGNLEGLKYGLI